MEISVPRKDVSVVGGHDLVESLASVNVLPTHDTGYFHHLSIMKDKEGRN